MHPIRNAIVAASVLMVGGCGSHASSQQASHTPAPQSSPTSSAKGWALKTHVNQMTDKKSTFAVDTSTGSSSEYTARFPALLIVACPGAGQKAQLFATDIASLYGMKGGSNDNSYPVNIRFDKNKPFKWDLAYSSSAHGYFFADPAEFLKKASKAQRMLIQYTQGDSQNTQIIVAFDMAGLSGVLNDMHCNW